MTTYRPGWSGALSRATRAMGTGAALSLLGATVAFVCNIVMSRTLGPSDRGQVAFILQTSYLISPIILLGVDRAHLRVDALTDPRTARSHLAVVASLLTVGLIGLFGDWRALAAPIAYALCWMTLARSASYREHRFGSYVLLVVLYQCFVLVSSLLLSLFGIDNWLLWLLPYAVPALVIGVFDLTTDFRGRLRRTFAGVSRISLSVLPSTVATMVILRAERVLMPLFSTDSELGIYVAVATATETLSWLAGALADHRVARLGRSKRTPASLVKMSLVDVAAFAGCSVVIGVLTFHLLVPVLGAAFEPGKALVLPLCLAAVVLAVFRQVSAWLLAGPRPGGLTVASCAGALVAVPVYAMSIHWSGALGAAWACVLVYGLSVLVGLSVAVGQMRRESCGDPA